MSDVGSSIMAERLAGVTQGIALLGNAIPTGAILVVILKATRTRERSNLSMRMQKRRFTSLTNAVSKKVEKHAYSAAFLAMYYNFVRIHKVLPTSPVMAANVTRRLFEIGDLVSEVVRATKGTRPNG